MPYTADWDAGSAITDAAQIVDGLWELTPDGPHTVETGYDRLLNIGDETFQETKGFGLAALEQSFQEQFLGKYPPLSTRKAEEPVTEFTIDGISGATVTTNAVLDALNELYTTLFPKPEATQAAPIFTAGDEITATKEGFMGPVTVKVTFKDDNSIVKAVIDTEQFSETPGYGAGVLEDSYTVQFAGKIPPLSLRTQNEDASVNTVENLVNVDTATSATKTSQAIVYAVNDAYEVYSSQKEVTVTKQGFMGPVIVTVSFNKDGRIEKVSINSETFMETPGYGAAVLTEEFAARFTGKTPPIFIRQNNEEIKSNLVENLHSVDTFTSATITMQAVIDAINEAFESRP